MSGTFPVTMTLTIDPTQITDTAQTSLVVDANWSLHQTETITIPVIAWFVQDRVWLPLMMR
jgi:p-aminobenzoyl-glutamate transporter AbgT